MLGWAVAITVVLIDFGIAGAVIIRLAVYMNGKKLSRYERAFTVSCVRNSGSSSPAGRRIWNDNKQGGGIVIAAFKLRVLQEVEKAIDRIDATAKQDSFEFSL